MSYRSQTEAERLAVELRSAHREIERLTESRRGEIVFREHGDAAPWVRRAIAVSFGACFLLAVSAVCAAAGDCDRIALTLAATAAIAVTSGLYIWWRALPRRGNP